MDGKNNLFFNDCVQIGREIWFSACNKNGIYKYDLDKKRYTFVDYFQKEKIDAMFLHSNIVQYHHKLYFIPFQAKMISVYDLVNRKIKEIKLPESRFNVTYSFFQKSLLKDDHCILVPCRYEKVIKLNFRDDTLEEFDIFPESIERMKRDIPYIFMGGDLKNDQLWLGSFQSNCVEQINLETNNRDKIYINDNIDGISHLHLYKDKLIVLNKRGCVLVCDMNGKVLNKKTIVENKNALTCFYNSVIVKDWLYISDVSYNYIYCYDLKNNSIQMLQVGTKSENKKFPLFWAEFTLLKESMDEEVLAMSVEDGGGYCIHNNKIKKILDSTYVIDAKEWKNINQCIPVHNENDLIVYEVNVLENWLKGNLLNKEK